MKTKYFFIVLLLICNVANSQTTYYVDDDAVDDSGLGTSEGTAWKTIAKVNGEMFFPGDEILFKSGQTFYGKLIVSSSGDSDDQITYGKYGGDAKPIINGRNYLACIYVNGGEYLTFNDLELINNSEDDTTIIDVSTNGKKNGAEYKRYGFNAYPGGSGSAKKNIILNNLEIHSIYPSTVNDNGEYSGDGIQFTSWGNPVNNIFDGITIENCEIYDVGILGISVNKWINESNPPPVDSQHHKNITVKNNYIHHTGGSGAVYFQVDGYLFEDNIFTYTGDYTQDTRQRGRGSGFWCVRTLNGILQYNEFSHAHGPKDSCGAHIDIENDNVIIQYNLSYDNAGGFAEFMGANTNCIYRYNVSINDGWRVKWDGVSTQAEEPSMYTAKGDTNGQRGAAVWFSNFYGCSTCDVGSTDNQVYNNTFYIGKHIDDGWEVDINSFIELEPDTDDNEIKNNIFYIEDDSSLSYLEDSGSGSGNVMQYNLYTNGGPDDTDSDIAYNSNPSQNEIYNADPLTLVVNKGGFNADDYMITSFSDAIDQGVEMYNNGGLDYWHNSLTSVPSDEFDIGAHERNTSCSDTAIFTGSWSSSPSSSKLVIIYSDYKTDTDGVSFDACQLVILPNVTLTITAGNYINVSENIINNGTLIVEHEGSVVQTEASAIALNKGTIEVEKITTALEPLDFTILGSPMTGATREVEYSVSTLVKYHDTSLFNPNVDVTAYDSGAENFADDNGDNWITHTGLLTPGEGYLVRPAAGGGTLTTTYNTGTLNNGNITYTALFGDNQNDSPNILSNPYASAIRIDDFLTANSNAGGTVYFWEHLTEQGTDPDYPGYQVANYDMGDISSCNGTGGLASANGGSIPTNLLPSGQGFAIKASGAGTITFTNTMRSTGPNTGYRKNVTAIDRLYLGVSNNTYGLRCQTLIGFTELATDGFDQNYDSKRLATPISLYSINDGRELGIQGRSVFHVDHIIPLGFTTHVEENQEYTISLSAIEGMLLEQATVYLKDNLLKTLTNLSETEYSFTSNDGHQIDRFVLVFTEDILGTNDLSLEAITIYPNPTQNIINIVSPQLEIINIEVYDVRGRKVISQANVQVDMSTLASAMYFIKINTESGSLIKRVVKE